MVESTKPGALRPEVVAEAIASEYDRRVLAACVKKAKAVKEISQETGLPLPSTYRHVNRLVELGVMMIERSAMTADGKRYELYRSRVRAARIEMDGNGERVSFEPNEATEERLASVWDSLRGQVGRR